MHVMTHSQMRGIRYLSLDSETLCEINTTKQGIINIELLHLDVSCVIVQHVLHGIVGKNVNDIFFKSLCSCLLYCYCNYNVRFSVAKIHTFSHLIVFFLVASFV